MKLCRNKQRKATIADGNSSAMSVRFWQVSGVGYCTSALVHRSRRKRSDEAKGQSRTATRTVKNKAETKGTTREVMAASALGPGPNTHLQRTRPRLRILPNLNGSGRGLGAEAGRLGCRLSSVTKRIRLPPRGS